MGFCYLQTYGLKDSNFTCRYQTASSTVPTGSNFWFRDWNAGKTVSGISYDLPGDTHHR